MKNITKQMTLLLKEYISSRDFDEAARCLRALEVPHYHHELVYEAVLMSMESVNQQTEEAMCTLLKAMDEACLVLPAQMEQVGFFFNSSRIRNSQTLFSALFYYILILYYDHKSFMYLNARRKKNYITHKSLTTFLCLLICHISLSNILV